MADDPTADVNEYLAWLDTQPLPDDRIRDTDENLTSMRPSIESEDNSDMLVNLPMSTNVPRFMPPLEQPVLAAVQTIDHGAQLHHLFLTNTPTSLAPIEQHTLAAAQTIGHSVQLHPLFLTNSPTPPAAVNQTALAPAQAMDLVPFSAEWYQQRLLEVSGSFVFPNRHEPTRSLIEDRSGRWYLLSNLINHDDAAISLRMSIMRPFDFYPNGDFYWRYVRCSWLGGPAAMAEAEWHLSNKLRNHERYLAEVNEVIALDPQVRPGDWVYDLRVYNTMERARVLNALEELENLKRDGQVAGIENHIIDPGHATLPSPIRSWVPLERWDNGGSDNDTSFGGMTEVERSNVNRGVAIIDPDTGHPIEFQRQSLTTTNNRGNGNRSENSEVLNHDGGRIGNVPVGSSDPVFDATSRPSSQTSADEIRFELEEGNITSWISQERWTEPRPRNGDPISNTVPRNFGRNVQNCRSPLRSLTEVDQEAIPIEPASTAATDGSRTPSTVINQ